MKPQATFNIIQEILETIPNIKDKIEETTNEFNNYSEYLGDEKYEEIPNEKEEDAIKRAESVYDRLDEIVQRRLVVIKNGNEAIELIGNAKLKIESIIKSCENDEIQLAKTNEELIEKIIELEERKMNKEIKLLQDQIDFIKQRFINKKNEWDDQRLNYEEYKRKKEEEEKKERWEELKKKIFEEERKKGIEQRKEIEQKRNPRVEMEQIEKWTKMKIGSILFDSEIDAWSSSTVLHQKIVNKSNLIFIIEDEEGNKFGGYVNAKIDKFGCYINDPKSFLFSLKSNGRLKRMMRFDIKDKQYAFYQEEYSGWFLFDFGYYGNDLYIKTEGGESNSHCFQDSFEYNGIENALCGKEKFTPKRIRVIQMVDGPN